jgi:threonine dehydrogenase-like Zn-dependent dehydrogenase
MRAIVFDGPAMGAGGGAGESVARLSATQTPPRPAVGEAIIRLSKAAVSNLDFEVARTVNGFHGIPGQQFVGVVESVSGQRASGNRRRQHTSAPTAPDPLHSTASLLGQRVVASITTACGECNMCVGGLRSHCRHRTVMGVTRDGCLAEHFALPVQNLVAVPDSVDDDHAVFAVELAAAIHAAEQLTIVGKPYITVLGDNSMALLTVQVMAKLNASVRLVGTQAEIFSKCEKWGIKHRHIDDIGRRADQDIVVDCTGTSEGIHLAMQMIRPRGKIMLKQIACGDAATSPPGDATDRQPKAPFTRSPSPCTSKSTGAADLTSIILNELEVIGSFAGPIKPALVMLAKHEVDIVSLITRRMSLDDGGAIAKAVKQPGAIKVLVEA